MDLALDVLVPVWGSAVAGYLLGSIPTGYLLGRARGLDVTAIGSGRTGGTNVLRILGPGPAALTAILDVAKGAFAVAVADTMFPSPLASAVSGTAAVIGHNWSVFIGWRGGAGTAAAFGALLAIAPSFALVLGLIVPGMALVTRYASVGSLAFAVFVPLALTGSAMGGQAAWETAGFGWAAALLILFSHRPNIVRLLRRQERRLWEPVEPPSEAVG
ncbi:MAG: glycerol-3-phosphate acyltransferase [Anaerolineae bacterium]